MNPPSLDIAKYLSSQGIGVLHGSADWGIHVASEPVKPNDVVTIYDTPGSEPDTDELDEYRPSMQIRVRSSNYLSAYSKQEAIRDLLIRDRIITETSTFYLMVLTSDILSIGRDENNRHILTANYRCRRTERN